MCLGHFDRDLLNEILPSWASPNKQLLPPVSAGGAPSSSGKRAPGKEIDVSTDEPEVRTSLDESFDSQKMLDMDVAFNAACGDYDFLIIQFSALA